VAELLAAVEAMAALPETGDESLPSYAPVMVFGGLALMGGLGIEPVRRRSRHLR
jgi:hypothetical protein